MLGLIHVYGYEAGSGSILGVFVNYNMLQCLEERQLWSGILLWSSVGLKKKPLHAKKEGMFMNLFTLRSECVCVREFALNGICFKSRHHFVHLEPSYPYIRSKHFNLP